MKKLNGKRAAWLGLLGTPVLVVAAVLLAGVTAGSAGPQLAAAPQAAAAPAAAAEAVRGEVPSLQTVAAIRAYWTKGNMETATPYPIAYDIPLSRSQNSVETVAAPSGPPTLVRMNPDGTSEKQTFDASAANAGGLTEAYHNPIPYTQFQWFGRYLRNTGAGSPNVAISAISKMFFTQDGDGDGDVENYVCSGGSIGNNAVWTAGHCVNNGLPAATDGFNNGWSYNILFCPSYDSGQGGVNPTAGCWADADGSSAWSLAGWVDSNLDFDYDFGAVDDLNVGTVQAGAIGTYTGVLGAAWNWGNVNWVSLGYPQGAPFGGGKIEVCLSSLGYSDSAGPSTPDSVAMGCDMTGGSSGGPWIFSFGRNGGQPGGAAGLWINGHNDWRHTATVNEMNSPYYDCPRVTVLYNTVNGTGYTC